jgi:N-dimethylarginine dimethylaminohydrolase
MQSFSQMFNGTAPVVIMCPPTYLELKELKEGEKHANAKSEMFYDEYRRDPGGFRVKADRDWSQLVDLYKKWGINVIEMPPSEGLVSQVYTADPAFTLLDTKNSTLNVVKSKLTNQSRPGEVEPFASTIQSLSEDGQILDGITIKFHQAVHNFEGTGDCYFDAARNMVFAGYTVESDDPSEGRSSLDAHAEVERLTNIEVVSLEVQRPCFHIDTCLTPLPSGHMLIYKPGMTDDAYNKLVQKAFIERDLNPDEYIIHVSENDGLNNFVTNLLCFGNKVALPQFGDKLADGTQVDYVDPKLIKRLEEIGYEVTVVNVPQLIKLGGAMHCTSHMLMPKVDGKGILDLACRY